MRKIVQIIMIIKIVIVLKTFVLRRKRIQEKDIDRTQKIKKEEGRRKKRSSQMTNHSGTLPITSISIVVSSFSTRGAWSSRCWRKGNQC
jgi:hypothetical protein